jgi:hypothetical protein
LQEGSFIPRGKEHRKPGKGSQSLTRDLIPGSGINTDFVDSNGGGIVAPEQPDGVTVRLRIRRDVIPSRRDAIVEVTIAGDAVRRREPRGRRRRGAAARPKKRREKEREKKR